MCEKARKHMCVADRRDMTLAVKVALNPNTTNVLKYADPWIEQATPYYLSYQGSASMYPATLVIVALFCFKHRINIEGKESVSFR